MRLQSRLPETGATPLRLAPSWDWTNHVGCWQEASASCRTDLPTGLLGCPHHTAAGFPPGNGPRENKMEAAQSFVTYPRQSQAHIPAVSYWLHRPALSVHSERRGRGDRDPEPCWRLAADRGYSISNPHNSAANWFYSSLRG